MRVCCQWSPEKWSTVSHAMEVCKVWGLDQIQQQGVSSDAGFHGFVETETWFSSM